LGKGVKNGQAAILAPVSGPNVAPNGVAAARWSRAQQEESIMSRLAIAFALALVATAANAQDATPGLSRAPAVGNPNLTQPFLFDGRMRGDGARQGAPADVHHPAAGVIVVQPKQPGREEK
jgi:hypothetical protein